MSHTFGISLFYDIQLIQIICNGSRSHREQLGHYMGDESNPFTIYLDFCDLCGIRLFDDYVLETMQTVYRMGGWDAAGHYLKEYLATK